jgi:PAS domain S-box-containing protein
MYAHQSAPSRRGSQVAFILAFIGVYFIAGKFGLSLAFMHVSASPVWPPTGLALAVLLRWGYWLWPGVFVGAFLVNFTSQGSLGATLGIATGNTLEAVVGAWLVCRYANGTGAFQNAHGIFKYVGLAAVVSPALSATIGVTSLCLGGSAQWQNYGAIWLTWWLGDVVSNLIVAPFLLLWLTNPARRLTARQATEAAALLVVLLLIAGIVFLAPLVLGTSNYPLAYVAMLPLLWAAFRFGRRAAASCALLISAIALWGTLRGAGPFATEDANQSLLFLQAFMGTITLSGLILAAVVTESKRAHEAVRESEARFRLLADSAPVLIWVNDQHGCQFVNSAYRHFFGVPESELLGFGWAKFVHPDDYERYVEGYKKAVIARSPFQAEVRCRRADGEFRWLLSTGLPRLPTSAEFAGYVGCSTDVSDIVVAREALSRNREELEKLVFERTATLRQTIGELEAFSYSLSHDMRAPIRAIESFTQIALAEFGQKVGPPATDYLNKVVSAAGRLDRLIQDVLAFTRLSRQEIELKSIDIDRLLRDIISERPELQAPRSEVTLMTPILHMRGHEASLTQCLTNLLDNAVKFVPQGVKAQVRVYSEPRDSQVRLWIEDNGIGIEPAAKSQLFQMFQRVHQTGDYSGTGMGLAIVRKAAERMGGAVGVESELGKGSRFWLQLPRGN